MNRLIKSLKFRVIVLCLVALIVIIAVIHYTVYATTRDTIEEQLEQAAQGIAAAAATTIMESIEEYEEFIETKDVNSAYYLRIRGYFADIKRLGDVKFIHTERKIGANAIEIIIDGEPVDTEYYAPPGSTYASNVLKDAAYETGQPVSFGVTTFFRWGELIGAYVPIFDRSGTQVGILGVGKDTSQLYDRLNGLQTLMITIYAVIIVLALVVLTVYSKTIADSAQRDKLTGAYNRRFFDSFIHDETKDCIKYNRDLALLMLDIDHFKKVNDTYGHAFGDEVLVAVSKTVSACLRKNDYFFRYGGEEFIVTISKIDIKSVTIIAERIRAAVENCGIYNTEFEKHIKVTISIGIANLILSGEKYLLENADKALYKAKEKRNGIALYERDSCRRLKF